MDGGWGGGRLGERLRWAARGARQHWGVAATWMTTWIAALALWPWQRPSATAMLLSLVAACAVKLLLFSTGKALGRGGEVEGPPVHAAGLTLVAAALLALLLVPSPLSAGVAIVDGALSITLLMARYSGRGWWAAYLLRRRAAQHRIALVGSAERLHGALAAPRELLGGQPVALLVDGIGPLPGMSMGRVPVVDLFGLERLMVSRAVERVVTLSPISPTLASFVAPRCRVAGIPCTPLGELAPSVTALGEALAHRPESLLGRPRIASLVEGAVQERRIDSLVGGKRVLITGAGGTLGAEIARMISRRAPSHLVLVDRAEGALVRIEREVGEGAACDFEAMVVDVRDATAVERLMRRARPDVVIHCAAQKYVALAERQPAETVLTNVFGTRAVVESALAVGAERCVLVSEFAAVNPTSVLGATKRICELYLAERATRTSAALVTVRLPNVLASSGSIAERLLSDLERGRPLVLPHPDAERYFTTLAEAAHATLLGGAIGKGGEVMIPEVGQPVSLGALAERMVSTAGLRLGREVAMCFSGLGAGERMQEQPTQPDEPIAVSEHPALWSARPRPLNIDAAIDALAEAALGGGADRVLGALSAAVPEYRAAPRSEALLAADEREARATPVTPVAGSTSFTVIQGG